MQSKISAICQEKLQLTPKELSIELAESWPKKTKRNRLYHAWPHSNTKSSLQLLDHSAIFWLIAGPRDNDDKGWWRELVDHVLAQVAPSLSEFDRDNFFEIAYEHFAESDVWELYPEVHGVLNQLQPSFQLAVVSNFDGRLRLILQHLGISKFFAHIFISSEIGADKPDPEIFRRALKLIDLKPNEVLHVGDDSERDWEAASAAGLSIFRLDRPNNSLRDLVTTLTTNGLE